MKLKALLFALVIVVAGGGFAAYKMADTAEPDILEFVPQGVSMLASIDLREDRSDALDGLLDGTPVGGLDEGLESITEAVAESSDWDCDFEEDIRPALPSRAVVFASVQNVLADPAFGAVLDVEQPQRAVAAIGRCAGAEGESASVDGHDYRLTDDIAYGVLEGHVVIATKQMFETVVGTIEEEDSIATSERFTEARGRHDADAVALLYVDLEKLPAVPMFAGVDGLDGAITLAAYAEQQTLTLETAFGVSPTGALAEFYQTALDTDLVADLPVTSWFGASVGDLGKLVEVAIDLAEEQPDPPFTGRALRRDVRAMTGLDLEKDILPWLGPGAFAMTGETSSWVSPTYLIETSRPAQMQRVVDHMKDRLRKNGATIERIILANVNAFHVAMNGEVWDVRATGNLLSVSSGGQPAIGGGDLDQTRLFTVADEALGGLPVSLFFDATQYKELYGKKALSPTGFDEGDILGAISYVAAGGEVNGSTVLIRVVTAFDPKVEVT